MESSSSLFSVPPEKKTIFYKSKIKPSFVHISFFSERLYYINYIMNFVYIIYIITTLSICFILNYFPSILKLKSETIIFLTVYLNSNIFIDVILLTIMILNIIAFYFYSMKVFSLAFSIQIILNLITMTNIRPIHFYKENLIYASTGITISNIIYFLYIIYYFIKLFRANVDAINNNQTLDNIIHEINLRTDMLKMKINHILIKLHLNQVLRNYMFSPNDFYFMKLQKKMNTKNNNSLSNSSRSNADESTLMNSNIK